MFINKKNLFNFTFIVIIIISLLSTKSFANKSVEDIDKENDLLFDKIMENTKDSDDKAFEDIMDKVREKDQEKNNTPMDLSGIRHNLYSGSVRLAVTARKYIVPITLLMLFFYIFMLSATGAKSIKNRKKYIFGMVFFYFFFLLILNLPLYILWRSSITIEGFLNYELFYNFVEGVSIYLKENSFVLSTIIFTFGMINNISSETKLPKRIASNFMIKMSFILFAFFNLMPFVLKLAM